MPFLLLVAALAAAPEPEWRTLGNGVSYAAIALTQSPEFGDGILHVVRVEPEKAEFRFVLASQDKGGFRTSASVAEKGRFLAVINAGMFEPGGAATGYLRSADYVNNPKWNRYKSLFVFGPKEPGAAKARVVDLDSADSNKAADQYRGAIQNLRLIGNGRDVWKPNGRKWSEAAIGADSEGRILLLFCRTPFSMTDFNHKVLALPLGVVRAMHVEGGPEASLSIRGGGLSIDLSGSYETGFLEDDTNHRQWEIPNFIGVASR